MLKKNRMVAMIAATVLLMVTVAIAAAASYTVQPGDTLSSIARRFSTSVNNLVQTNGISNPNLIFVGDVIEVPDGSEPPATPPPTTPPEQPNPPAPPSEGTTYVVQAGDTLSRIAGRFGTTVGAIAQANGIANINFISVGQRLVIPGGSGTPPVSPPANPPSSPPPSNPTGFALGGQTTGFGSVNTMRSAGMTWIKIQHKWSPGDSPNVVSGAINEARNNNLKILLSITGANVYPQPNSIDFGGFTQFLGGVAALGPDAIEVWNEQNIDFEWPAGQISPADYVNNMLRPGYQAIKAANPNVMVISGALAPTGFDNNTNAWADDRYLAGMRAAGAASYADCIGVHHNAGATSPAVTTGHPAAYHYSWYFLPTLNLYYDSFGGVRPLCFTELGYLSGDGFGGLPGNFSWASGTSVSEHAQWLGEAVDLAQNSGKVSMIIVFNVDFTVYGDDPQAGFAIIRPDGSCPACGTLNTAVSN